MTDRSTTATAFVTLELEPLDVLFCGGGRPLAPTSRVTSSTPTPQMVAGAIRTWLLQRSGVDFQRLGSDIRAGADFAAATAEQGEDTARVGRLALRGPWFTLKGERLVPTPSTVHEVDDCATVRDRPLCSLAPLSPDTAAPGWSGRATGSRPLWRRSAAPSAPRGGYLRPGGLRRFLSGQALSPEDVMNEDDLFRIESRHGIGMNSRTNTAREGLIYQIDVLRLERQVRLEVELAGTTDDLVVCPTSPDVLALGGEGRRVVVRPSPNRAPGSLPGGPKASRGDGALILLTTPGLFDGWRPPDLDLVAASVPGNMPVSGWNLALGGPKRTRFAAPAGSVYFLAPGSQRPDGGTLCAGEDGNVGWGAFVDGVWTYA